MAVQDDTENASNSYKPTDYNLKTRKSLASRFLFKCATQLRMKSSTSATAAQIFHRYFKKNDNQSYDEFLIACACLYLSGKLKEDNIKIRDLINAAHNNLNADARPMRFSVEYRSMRDDIVKIESIIVGILNFQLNFTLPHKYLYYYMKTLQEWLGPRLWNSILIAKSAELYLQDFHHSAAILDYKPEHVAICSLSLALQTFGIHPTISQNRENSVWYNVFAQDLTKEKHWEIVQQIVHVYVVENLNHEY